MKVTNYKLQIERGDLLHVGEIDASQLEVQKRYFVLYLGSRVGFHEVQKKWNVQPITLIANT